MKSLSYPRLLSLVCLVGTLSFMSGCSADMNLPDTQGTGDFGVVHGGVYGGQQPITAAEIFVFETTPGNNSGYGNVQPRSLVGVSPSNTATACTAAKAVFPIVRIAAAKSPTGAAICYYQTGGYNGGGQVNPLPDGEFQLTGTYTCDVGQNVWLYSLGGYPTNGTTGVNQYATLMADLGVCPSTGNFSADSFIFMNELSTVAMAYAVAGFTADPVNASTSGLLTKISAPSSNLTGINNAFANAQQLYNIFGLTDQGDLSAPQTTTFGARNGVPPYTLINTLGDMLAGCINSAPNTTANPSPNCNTLFSGVYASSTITDTASAAIHLAKNPNRGLQTGLLVLANNNNVWQPYYNSSNAPQDLSAAIVYTGVGSPAGVVLGPNGNAFVNNYTSGGYMAKLTPLGAVTTTSGLIPVIDDAATLAIDSSGLIWTPSVDTGAIYAVTNSSAFTAVSDTAPLGEPAGTLSTTSLLFPDPVMAADTGGYIYVADAVKNGGEIYKTNAAGNTTVLDAATATGPGALGCLTAVTGVALDGKANSDELWVTTDGQFNTPATPSTVCRISNDGATVYTAVTAPTSKGQAGITNADAVAVGLNGSAWVLDETHNDLYNVTITSTTAGTVSAGHTGGGMQGPVGLIVDGSGYVWVVNNSNGPGSISEFDPTGTPVSLTNGYQYQNLTQPSGIGIDISGNVWVSNYGGGNVMEVIGIATPTAPLVAGTPAAKP